MLEDLHWIDPETQAVLDGLTESLPAARAPPRYVPAGVQARLEGKTVLRARSPPPAAHGSAEELLSALLVVGRGDR